MRKKLHAAKRDCRAARGNLIEQVRQSYLKHGWSDVRLPCDLSLAEFRFRVACMQEELSEYAGETEHPKRLDALVDLAVFVMGTVLRHGYGPVFNEAFERVVLANMEKRAGAVGGQRGESRFDLRKPEGWTAPDLTDLIEKIWDGNPAVVMDETQRRYAERGLDARLDVRSSDDEVAHRVVTDPQFGGRTLVEWQEVEAERDALNDVARHRREEMVQIEVDRERWRNRAQELEQAKTVAEVELESIPKVVRDAVSLCIRKSQDYNSAMDWSKAEYHPFGHHSYLQMLHTKLTRLRSVVEKTERGEEINFESGRDSLLDLINYSIFYGTWMDEQAGEEAVESWSPSGSEGPVVDPVRQANLQAKESLGLLTQADEDRDPRFGNELDD